MSAKDPSLETLFKRARKLAISGDSARVTLSFDGSGYIVRIGSAEGYGLVVRSALVNAIADAKGRAQQALSRAYDHAHQIAAALAEGDES